MFHGARILAFPALWLLPTPFSLIFFFFFFLAVECFVARFFRDFVRRWWVRSSNWVPFFSPWNPSFAPQDYPFQCLKPPPISLTLPFFFRFPPFEKRPAQMAQLDHSSLLWPFGPPPFSYSPVFDATVFLEKLPFTHVPLPFIFELCLFRHAPPRLFKSSGSVAVLLFSPMRSQSKWLQKPAIKAYNFFFSLFMQVFPVEKCRSACLHPWPFSKHYPRPLSRVICPFRSLRFSDPQT